MNAPASVRRTAEIEEPTNRYFIHPLAARLVPLFARLRVTPNAVSLTGLLFGLLAAYAYYHYRSIGWDVAGFAFMIAWHVMDGADGQLARFTRTHSHFGKVLDGIADILTFAAVYIALALALRPDLGAGIVVLVAAAGGCHAIQAATYEALRHEYDRQAWGRESPRPDRSATGRAAFGTRILERLDRLYYVGLGFPSAGVIERGRESIDAALKRQPADEAVVRERYREAFAPLLREGSLLSSNYHTLAIFGFAVANAPRAYFWFTILGFNLFLIAWLRRMSVRVTEFRSRVVAREP